jgi:hypothetical protein
VRKRLSYDRLSSAIPLAVGYLVLCSLYSWQASKRDTPTIFTDELQFAQVSRAIAETGRPAWRGQSYGFDTLYTVLQAPVWWLDDTADAYGVAKTLGVLLMTAAVFPAYLLARTVLSRPWALFAALATGVIPGLSYAPFLMEEPLAYPYATLTLWLIARALADVRRGTILPALAACAVAPLVRGQLAVLIPTLALGLGVLLWQAARFRELRRGWSAWDWAGVVALGIGFMVAASAFLGHQSESWYRATGFYKGRMLEYGLWAVGALGIGIGILPLVGGLAALALRGNGDRAERAFVITTASAIACFGFYTAVKAAYISTEFATRVEERNVIYLAPLLFIGTAMLLERPRARLWAVGAAGLLALYLVRTTPYELESYPYGDAPALSMLALGNREFALDAGGIERVLVVALLIGVALLVARTIVRGDRLSLALAGVTAAAILAWTLTAEIYAARGFDAQASQLFANLPQPADWVDEATGGEPAMYFGQAIDDPNGIYLLEFWNRTVEKVWSLDGSARPPTLSPDLASADGTLTPSPEVDWVVGENDVRLAGEKVGEPRGSLQLYRIDGPLKLESSVGGILGDGWMGSTASFTQYAPVKGAKRGFAKIFLSRSGWCGPDVPGNVTVKVGSVVVSANQPAIEEVRTTRRGVLHACSGLPFLIPATVPFRVEVTIEPTFSPAELDERSSDQRQLGAQPSFAFLPPYEVEAATR